MPSHHRLGILYLYLSNLVVVVVVTVMTVMTVMAIFFSLSLL